MTTDTITPAVERLADFDPTPDTLAVAIRMVLGAGFTQTDLDVCADFDLLTVRQYEDLSDWLRTHHATAGTLVGGRR